jgi:formylglycine-generating enzyme required for sulfatase activity
VKLLNFDVITLNGRGQESKREQRQAEYFSEDLDNNITLKMVLISGGSFMMGSPENELERSDSESPQRRVNIKQFCMGKYPVTQAQWKAVAKLPQVNIELKPDPSYFKGDKRPVEGVSWHGAVEFCDRLTTHTKRQYRLPSEAEWEYACRAGTTTPFHFGETITTDVANYNGTEDEEYQLSSSCGQGSKDIYRKETTVVGSFGIANAFGLYDMHGNVFEWCADHWHENYEGAPTDGSAWIEPVSDNHNGDRLMRGGTWIGSKDICRCAYRLGNWSRHLGFHIGFRVVCAGAV